MDAPLLREVTDGDRPVIERLWQLYSHDMSEVREPHIPPDHFIVFEV